MKLAHNSLSEVVVYAAPEIPLQETSLDIWDKKYRLKTKHGDVLDTEIDDTYKRVAKALADVWKTNDLASEKYKPAKYPGKIINFLPMKEYKSHTHPGMDWHDLAREVDKQILSVYPAGMLVQPFVKELAQSVRAEIFRIGQMQQPMETPRTIRAKKNGQKQLPPANGASSPSDQTREISNEEA